MSIPLMFALKDVILKESACSTLLLEKHSTFIQSYELKKNDYEYIVSEYLRMSGVYWCLTAMDLMAQLPKMNTSEILDFVKQCHCSNGGFAASHGHDAQLLHTLSAVQILILYDSLDLINIESVVNYVAKLQQEDGSFCAVSCLALLNRLDAIDVEKCVDYVLKCQNFDFGFGLRIGSESHAGQIYCCLGVLSITGYLNKIDPDEIGWWLCERQCDSGGLNGRPEKLPDVCYSWWVLSSLAIIGRLHFIDKEKLVKFILACQDDETGGFSDRPGYMSDPFHTVFGLAGLSLLGEKSLKRVNPVFCMPEDSLKKLNIYLQFL